MQLHFLLSSTHISRPACALTFGNFDGVHRGHQALLQQLRTYADAHHLPTAVLLFEPQPAELLAPAHAPARLTALRDKIHHLSACGIDHLYCLRFTPSIAAQSAAEFVNNLLFTNLQAQIVVVGEDACFGQGRLGNVALLRQLAAAHQKTLHVFSDYQHHHTRISSTLIRHYLTHNELDLAAQLLGHPYTVLGRVTYGQGLGRKLGFPTANLHLHYPRPLLRGVYVVRCKTQQGNIVQGVANWGIRPTCQGKLPQLEVHLLDVDDNLYGQFLEVQFLKQLRAERTFPSLAQLTYQISQDIAAARQFFSGYAPPPECHRSPRVSTSS